MHDLCISFHGRYFVWRKFLCKEIHAIFLDGEPDINVLLIGGIHHDQQGDSSQPLYVTMVELELVVIAFPSVRAEWEVTPVRNVAIFSPISALTHCARASSTNKPSGRHRNRFW